MRLFLSKQASPAKNDVLEKICQNWWSHARCCTIFRPECHTFVFRKVLFSHLHPSPSVVVLLGKSCQLPFSHLHLSLKSRLLIAELVTKAAKKFFSSVLFSMIFLTTLRTNYHLPYPDHVVAFDYRTETFCLPSTWQLQLPNGFCRLGGKPTDVPTRTTSWWWCI